MENEKEMRMGANKKEKEVRWKKKEGNERNRTQRREKRKKKGEQKKKKKKKKEFFLAFRQSKLDGPRRKVGPIIASYALVPKSWSFVKLHEVRNFPTLSISNLKVI